MAPSGSKHQRVRPEARGSSSSSQSRPQSTQSTSAPSFAQQSHTHVRPQGSATTLPQASTSTGTGRKKTMSGALLLPLLLIALVFGGLGSFGNSCRYNGDDTTFFNYTGSQDATPSYQVGEGLGTGNAAETWTVLMYLCGSDLESTNTRLGGGQATNNLIELTKANLGANVNYVIETGGAKKWQNNVVDPRYLNRFVVDQGALALVDRQASASMADQATFADFLNWGVKTYPADHYMVVVWDHGGGTITGVCQDDLYPRDKKGQTDSLTVAEMRDALKSVGTKFDVIGFDTCLMATVETADALSPYADYLVASEESEPGSGWDYTTWPAWLGEHTGTSGADLGTVICQSYYNKCKAYGQSGMATLSVIDMAKMPALSKAFMNVSDDIARATVDPTSLRRLSKGARSTQSYGADGLYSMNMVDLGDLMNKTSDVVGSDAAKLVKAIDDAVVFEAHGKNRSAASGLSVYYPLQITDRNDFYRYAEITSNTPYLQFLAVMFGVYDDYNWNHFSNAISLTDPPVQEEDLSIQYDQRFNNEGHLNLTITEGADKVARVAFELYVYLDKLDTLCYLGSDNDMYGSYDEGWFRDNFQGEWLTIDGHFISATLTEEAENYNLYYVPILLNDEQTGLVMEYDFTTDEFSVVCVHSEANPETGMTGKTGQLLQEGDTIQFLFPAQNQTLGTENVIPLESMTWHEDAVITYTDLGDATFGYRYTITDLLGQTIQTDMVYQKYSNGRPQV